MRTPFLFLFIFSLTLLVSCGDGGRQEESEGVEAPSQSTVEALEEEAALEEENPSALDQDNLVMDREGPVNATKPEEETLFKLPYLGYAVPGPKDRLLKKSASLQLEVKDVVGFSNRLKAQADAFGGFALGSSANEHTSILERSDLGYDSVAAVMEHYTVASIRLRVPSARLDSFLAVVSEQALKTKNLSVEVEDLTLATIDKQEEKEMRKKLSKEREALRKNTKEAEAIDQNALLDAYKYDQEALHKSRKDLRRLADAIAFAHVDVHLSGPKSTYVERKATVENMMPRSAFWPDFLHALGAAWYYFERFMVLLAYGWPFFLLAALLVVGVYYLKQYRKKQKEG